MSWLFRPINKRCRMWMNGIYTVSFLIFLPGLTFCVSLWRVKQIGRTDTIGKSDFYIVLKYLVTQLTQNRELYKATIAQIWGRKSYFPHCLKTMLDRPTNQQDNRPTDRPGHGKVTFFFKNHDILISPILPPILPFNFIWKNTPMTSHGYSGQRAPTVAIRYPWLTYRKVADVS